MDSVPTVEELKKLRVVDLKERLGKLGKSTSGLKAELIDRLYNALSEQAGNVDMVPPTGPLASYSQVENLQQMPQMNPESPVVEVTIDAAQFDCNVEQPQMHHEVFYRHQQEEVERLRIQQQQEDEMIRRHRQQEIQREQEEMERQRLQHEEIIRRQQEEAERLRQQQEAERLRQQQEEAEILRRQQEEAEILRRQQEAEQALLHQNEMERLRREQQETELLRLQEQEAEILRRQQEETELLRRQEEEKFLRQQHEERVRLDQEETERLRRSELLKYQQEEAERLRWEQEEADRLQREENERIRLQQEATEFRRLQELEATQAQQRENELLRRRNEEEAEIRRRQEEEADLLWHLHQRSGMEAAANRMDDTEPLNLKCADDNEATLQYQRQLEISGRLKRQQEEQEEMDRLKKQQEDAEREREIKIQEEMEQERQRKLQEEEMERERQRLLQEEEAERERQRKLLQEAAEREKQRRLQEEAEKERQRKLQEEEERERQRKIQEEAERERQRKLREEEEERERLRKLREEEERERQRKLREEEEERERLRKLREEEEEKERQRKLREEEEEKERQRKLREEEERERQRKLREEEERERQKKLREEEAERERQKKLREEEAERERLRKLQELERLKKLQEEEAERERQRQLQEVAERERRKKQEEEEKERQRKLQEELERQRKLEEEELRRKEEEARILQAKREEEERVRMKLEMEEQERQRQLKEEEERLKREKELQQRQMKEAEEARLKKLYEEEQERQRLKKEEEELIRRRKIEEEQRLQKEKMEEEKRLQIQKEEGMRERQLTEEHPVDVSMGIGPLPPPPPPPNLDTICPGVALSMTPMISEGVVYPSSLQMVPNMLQPWSGIPAQGYQQPMMMDVMPGYGAPLHQFPQASPPPSSSPPPIPGLGPPSPSHGKLDQLGKPPALMSLDIQKPTDEMLEDDLRLPQALEKILALKIERAQMLGVDPDVIPASETHDDDQTKEPNAEEAVGTRPQQPESKEPKPSKNKQRKMKKKKRAHRRRDIEQIREISTEEGTGEKEAELDVEVQYISDSLDLNPADPMYSHFMKIFEAFKLTDPEAARREAEEEANRAKLETKKEPDLRKKPKDADEEPEEEPKKEEQPKLSKRKLKKLNRLSIAELKQHVCRPDVVEMHDVTAKDPKLLVLLKSTRNTVPVPRHWCFKRKFLQGKRGIEKPPFNLPDFIKKTGIMEMRQALQEKEDQKTLKAKMRERVRPKMGKIDIDYQKLHDAFFKWQTKPKMTIHGDLYYEGKEFETRLKEKKPGELSDELRTALGMPIGANAHKVPPPWLIAMQRYGPPPSYPNLKIPGLNSPIPEGCAFGYHAGGWGKPPVDEMGKPLYGDVFGMQGGDYQQSLPEEEVDRTQWGELESESESESEEEEEEEEEEEQEEEDAGEEPDKGGLVTPAEGGLVTPSGLSSIPVGMETPDMIELRKRKIESEMEGGETPALYTILPEKKTDRIGGAMMGSTHVYDIAAAVPGRPRIGGANPVEGGVEVALDPSELDLDTATMTARYEQTLREQQNQLEKEDLSDMVAEHSAKQKNKRKRAAGEQHIGRAIKKYKDFKF